MQVHPLSPLGGIEIEGVDLTSRTPDEDRALRRLFDEHGLVVFRGQSLTKPQLLAAAEPFGGAYVDKATVAHDPEAPGVQTMSTRGAHGEIIPQDPDELVGYADWHTDDGYVTAPCRGKLLYAVEIPEDGGLTGFIDGQATYDALSEDLKTRVAGLHVIQSWNKIQQQIAKNRRYRRDGEQMLADNRFPDLIYPLTYSHPITSEPVLNAPRTWVTGIHEMPDPQGDALLEQLLEHIHQPKFQYWHYYRPGDAVIWDNWRFVHAASGTPGRYVRIAWTIAIKPGPVLGQLLERSAAQG